MNQTHEAIRWLYQDKQLKPDKIARRLNLNTASVHVILRKMGFQTVSQRHVVPTPTAYPDPVDREPCFRCGVLADVHTVHGCRRYS